MHSDLEEIKARLNIVDVLGEYIRLEKAGSNFRALCPFHNEKSPSFMVSEEKQMWKCFGCQKGGDIFGFVMEMEGIGFREALKILAEKAGVKLAGYDPKKTEEKNRTLEIMELATKWYEYQLWNGPGKTKILNYLRERGLKDETIKEFRLGYAPKGWRNILSFLLSRGFEIEEIEKTGLLVRKNNSEPSPVPPGGASSLVNGDNYYDRFRERIMFPIADYSGKVVGYSARVAPGGDEKSAKYVNTPETEVYHKSRILYGIDKARNDIKAEDFVLLVEGNMDVIAAAQAGIKNVVAVSGTALTPEQIKIIKRYTPRIKMFFDMDSAGYVATKKSVKLACENDMNVEIVGIARGKDAADIARENPQELVAAVKKSQNAVEYILEKNLAELDKNKAGDKRKISDVMVEVLGSLASAVEKSHWVKVIAQKLETTEAALTDALKKANLKNRLGQKEESVADEIANVKKIDVLMDELTGMVIAFPGIWKEAAEKDLSFLPKDRLLGTALEKGKIAGFDYDKFLAEITATDPELRERAERLCFRKKYQMSLNNELEEVTMERPVEELAKILNEIKKEFNREKLEKITHDLKLAEEKKDQEAIKFLRLEFNKLLEETTKLS